MIYYRCDLCGNEQELRKVEPTVYDPCAQGYKLPDSVASRVEGVEEICKQCYREIMAVAAKIRTLAEQDANQAMFEKTINLWTRTNNTARVENNDPCLHPRFFNFDDDVSDPILFRTRCMDCGVLMVDGYAGMSAEKINSVYAFPAMRDEPIKP